MTENENSPENLRKFLESDDPALIQMGLSMAKGSGVPDDLLGEILWMYMFHDDKTTRAAAKATFMNLAPEDAKQAVKKKWKASYRNLTDGTSKTLHKQLSILGKALSHTNVDLFEQLIKALEDEDWQLSNSAASALAEIDEKRAVKPLIETLEGKWTTSGIEALAKIGDKRAVEPLIKIFRDDNTIAEALGKIGDKRAVEPLIRALATGKGIDPKKHTSHVAYDKEYQTHDGRAWKDESGGGMISMFPHSQKEALVKIGKPAVELLIKALEEEDWRVRRGAAVALGEIRDERAVEPLIKTLQHKNSSVHEKVAEILKDFDSISYSYYDSGDGLDYTGTGVRSIMPLIKTHEEEDFYDKQRPGEILSGISKKYLSDDIVPLLDKAFKDNRVRYSVAEALGKIGDKNAVEPLIKALEDDDWIAWCVRTRAAEALGKISDLRAIGPIITALKDKDDCAIGAMWDSNQPTYEFVRNEAKKALKNLANTDDDIPEALHKLPTDEQRAIYLIAKEDWESLIKLGEPAVLPLIEALRDDYYICKVGGYRWDRYSNSYSKYSASFIFSEKFKAVKALGEIGDKRAVEPLIELLKNMNGYDSMFIPELKKVLKKRGFSTSGNKPDLIARLKDKAVQKVTKEALKKLGHEVE